jgi:hypothetical protein
MAKKAAKKSVRKRAKAPVKAAAKIKNLKPKAVSAGKAKAVKGGMLDTSITEGKHYTSLTAPTTLSTATVASKIAPTTTTQFKY